MGRKGLCRISLVALGEFEGVFVVVEWGASIGGRLPRVRPLPLVPAARVGCAGRLHAAFDGLVQPAGALHEPHARLWAQQRAVEASALPLWLLRVCHARSLRGRGRARRVTRRALPSVPRRLGGDALAADGLDELLRLAGAAQGVAVLHPNRGEATSFGAG